MLESPQGRIKKGWYVKINMQITPRRELDDLLHRMQGEKKDHRIFRFVVTITGYEKHTFFWRYRHILQRCMQAGSFAGERTSVYLVSG